MSDLFMGQTMTEFYTFTTPTPAVETDFVFNFGPDKVVFNNLTKWDTTSSQPISIWWRDQTTAAHAFQQQVIVDNGVTANKNFRDVTSGGFTVANTEGGQATSHATISGVTAADPVVITHSTYTFQTNQIVRITDLGNVGVTDRGMEEINNKRFLIVVISPTTFSLKDVITGEPIDGTAFTAYVSGGRICLETHVLTLNNPQVSPYSSVNPYHPNQFVYDPITYTLTVGTSVLKDASTYNIEVYKWGRYTDLGVI